jgi:hypothetical protein
MRPVSTPLSTITGSGGPLLQAQVIVTRSNSARLVLLTSSGRINTVEVKILADEVKAEVIKSEWIDGLERQQGDLLTADISEQGHITALGRYNPSHKARRDLTSYKILISMSSQGTSSCPLPKLHLHTLNYLIQPKYPPYYPSPHPVNRYASHQQITPNHLSYSRQPLPHSQPY